MKCPLDGRARRHSPSSTSRRCSRGNIAGDLRDMPTSDKNPVAYHSVNSWAGPGAGPPSPAACGESTFACRGPRRVSFRFAKNGRRSWKTAISCNDVALKVCSARLCIAQRHCGLGFLLAPLGRFVVGQHAVRCRGLGSVGVGRSPDAVEREANVHTVVVA